MTATADTTPDPLQNVRVLIVEDETLVAMLVEDYLIELGCVVVVSARRVARALEALETESIDAAVLDMNVAGDDISPLITLLIERKIPFLFASGYGSKSPNQAWGQWPMLQKPFDIDQLRSALLTALKT